MKELYLLTKPSFIGWGTHLVDITYSFSFDTKEEYWIKEKILVQHENGLVGEKIICDSKRSVTYYYKENGKIEKKYGKEETLPEEIVFFKWFPGETLEGVYIPMP